MLLFESFKNIEIICRKYEIIDYNINPDGTVDVDGDVNLSIEGLKKIPLKFGRVTGSFDCSENKLASLEGSPEWVGGHFRCGNNRLSTLEGCPKKVEGDFYCYHNQLTSLKGAPKWVVGGFSCYKNQLTSLEGAPEWVGGDFWCYENLLFSLEGAPKEVVGNFNCSGNHLTSLEGGPKEVGGNFSCTKNPIHSIYKLFGNYKSYLDSLDYGYLRGTDIVRSRFKEALEEIGKELPESIPDYKYI